jgi:hypothetical protein
MTGKGELENRDAEELGDLSEDHGLERGDYKRYSQVGSGLPADMQRNAVRRGAAAAANIGSPQFDFDVRSTYDSRPVWGRDFNEWFAFGEGPHDPAGAAKCFVVPTGFVCVLRRVAIRYSVFEYNELTPYSVGIARNGVIVSPEIVDSPSGLVGPSGGIPLEANKPIDTFLIFDEGMTVGVIFTSMVNDEVQLAVGFYGNFLLKTNVPANFQIANPAGVRGPAKTVNPSSLEGQTIRSKDIYRGVPLVGQERLGKGRPKPRR